MKARKYKQINRLERDRIEALLLAGHSQSDIAKVLKRPPCTISREIQNNRRKVRTSIGTFNGQYQAFVAQHKAYVRRRYSSYQGQKINSDLALKKYIISKLKTGWSPDEISGRMKSDMLPFYASKNVIYDWLYSPWGQAYCKHLKYKRYNPKKRRLNKTKKHLIPHRIGIELRPSFINNNVEYGHCEADTIVSGKKTKSTSALVVNYQRKSKYVSIKKIPNLKPCEFNNAIAKFKHKQVIKSITLDNGIENQHHFKLNLDTYFCDSYASWQKGGVENVNGMIRKYIPKGSNISTYSNKFIKKIETILNNKPRKSLNYKTPHEVMIEHNLLFKNKKSRAHKVALRG